MSTQVRDTLRFLQTENRRLNEENQELREEVALLHEVLDALRALHEVSDVIDANTNVLGLLDRILQSALTTIGASDGSLTLVDDETGELVFVVVYGEVRDMLLGHRMPVGEGITGWVAQHAQPLIVPDVHADPRFSSSVDQTFHFQTRSMLCVPLVYGGKVLGALSALNKVNGEAFDNADLTLLGVVAQLAATAMQRAEEAVSE